MTFRADLEDALERAEDAEFALARMIDTELVRTHCEQCGVLARVRSSRHLPMAMDVVALIMQRMSDEIGDEAVMDHDLEPTQIGAVLPDHTDGCPSEVNR